MTFKALIVAGVKRRRGLKFINATNNFKAFFIPNKYEKTFLLSSNLREK